MPVAIDTALRFGHTAHGLYEWARGGWIGVRTTGGTEFLGGYQRVTGYTDGHVSKLEQRVRQQITTNFGKIAGGTIGARLRVEERFRRGGDGIGVRARTQLRYNYPLDKSRTLIVSHESFWELNDTSWGSRTGLRRMRNYVAIELPVARQLRAQVGYLNQYDFGLPGKRDAMANILSLNIGARF